MMLKIFYKFVILPYTIFLFYLMFFGMGRYQYEVNEIRIVPVLSTLRYIELTIRWSEIITIVGGNVVAFIPFGFLGWIFPQFNKLHNLIFHFVSVIIIVEMLQYFTRMGVFDVDDILLNTFGVFLGFLLREFIEKRLGKLVV